MPRAQDTDTCLYPKPDGFKFHFTANIPSRFRSSNQPLSSTFSNQSPVCFLLKDKINIKPNIFPLFCGQLIVLI
jgi:hypothetical protein